MRTSHWLRLPWVSWRATIAYLLIRRVRLLRLASLSFCLEGFWLRSPSAFQVQVLILERLPGRMPVLEGTCLLSLSGWAGEVPVSWVTSAAEFG
jgi:hypothetical protein